MFSGYLPIIIQIVGLLIVAKLAVRLLATGNSNYFGRR